MKKESKKSKKYLHKRGGPNPSALSRSRSRVMFKDKQTSNKLSNIKNGTKNVSSKSSTSGIQSGKHKITHIKSSHKNILKEPGTGFKLKIGKPNLKLRNPIQISHKDIGQSKSVFKLV